MRAVEGLRATLSLHHVQAFGLIDRDGRTDAELATLAGKGIFAIEACAVESLYYCRESIEAVAARQAATFGCDGRIMAEAARDEALRVLGQDRIAKELAARRCVQQLREALAATAPSWEEIIKLGAAPIGAPIASPFPAEIATYRRLLAGRDLDRLMGRYPIRYSDVRPRIAAALRFRNHADYEHAVIAELDRNEVFKTVLRRRLGPLVEMVVEKGLAAS